MAFSNYATAEIRTTGDDANGGLFNGGAVVATPSAPAVAGSGTGGTVAANTYYCVIALVDQYGITSKSAETSVTLAGVTSSFIVTAPAADFDSFQYWNLYVGTTSGGPFFPQGTLLIPGTNRSVTATPPTTGTQPPGTDYSKQDAAQHSYTDIVIGNPTTTTITSAGRAFTPADVGNTINVTSGVGFTVQRLEITGCTAAGVATVDKSAGTAASTGGTGSFGGAFLSPGMASSLTSIAGWIKAGTYDCSNSSNVSGGRLTWGSNGTTDRPAYLKGYQTTRGDFGTRPVLRPTANSVTLITLSGSTCGMDHLEINKNGFTGSVGISTGSGTNNRVRRCKVDAATGIVAGGQACQVIDNEVLNFASGGIQPQSTGIVVRGNTIHAGTASASAINASAAAACIVEENLIYDVTGPGITISANSRNATVRNNSVDVSAGSNVAFQFSGVGGLYENNIGVTNNNVVYQASGAADQVAAYARKCAGYRASGSPTFLSMVTESCVVLTGNPFVDSPNGDMNLNTTAGAGGECDGIGFPGTWPGGGVSTTSARDIGAPQAAAAAASGAGPLVGPGRLARA